MRTKLVAFLIIRHILPKRLLALLAHEGHFRSLCQSMCLCFRVAFRTVEPLFAAWRADGNLGVQNVFTAEETRVGNRDQRWREVGETETSACSLNYGEALQCGYGK